MNRYKVTCLKCNGSNVVGVDEKAHRLYWDVSDRIVSGRFRLDGQWGWQCLCGQNSLLTEQENKHITDKVNPDPKEIADIIANLVPDKRQMFDFVKASS